MYPSTCFLFSRCAKLVAAVAVAALTCAAQTSGLTTLYNFAGGNSGANPSAGVTIGGNGSLFGTTPYGGSAGYGTIYELTPGTPWTETVLHSFQGGSDGAFPVASLTLGTGGVFYGTTSAGGATGNGTVFELTPPKKKGGAWTETVLYSFEGIASGTVNTTGNVVTWVTGTPFVTGAPWAGKSINIGATQYTIASVSSANSLTLTTSAGDTTSPVIYSMQSAPPGPWAGWPDGGSPQGGVIVLNGNLYGTTFGGGNAGSGTVFELVPPAGGTGPWTEQVIWNVGAGGAKFGSGPESGVVASNGNLYGTTCCGTVGGMVFKLTPPTKSVPTWTEHNIFSFTSYSIGKEPVGGLAIDSNGIVYGTTKEGGKYGAGIVFSLTPSSAGKPYTLTTIWSLTNGADGGAPYGSLLLGSAGQLYATVTAGCQYSVGGVLEFVPPATKGGAWTQNVLYNFTGGTDGSQPFAGVILGGNGNLYGTTVFSNFDLGYGTVFTLVP